MSDFIVNFLEEVVILPIITFVIGILFNVLKRYGSRARRRKLTRLKIGSEDDDIIDEPEFVKYYKLDFTPPELIEETGKKK